MQGVAWTPNALVFWALEDVRVTAQLALSKSALPSFLDKLSLQKAGAFCQAGHWNGQIFNLTLGNY